MTLLRKHPDIQTLNVARNGSEAIALIRAERPDLVFLDVQMPGLGGLDVLREITPAEMPVTVFVTAYDRYAIQAFEAHAFDYLLKPFSDERFESALRHVRKFIAEAPELPPVLEGKTPEDPSPTRARTGYFERIVIRGPGRVGFLPVEEIDWIEAAGVYITLHVGAKQHLHRSSIVQLLQRLDPQRFVRIHRSAVVNTSRIRELHPRSHGDYTLVLKDGRKLILSRLYRRQFESWLRQPL